MPNLSLLKSLGREKVPHPPSGPSTKTYDELMKLTRVKMLSYVEDKGYDLVDGDYPDKDALATAIVEAGG